MISILAPAKINWTLRITGKRPDNFHNIVSIMQSISLYDKIEILPSDDIIIKSNLMLPVKENLVYKAAELLKSYTSTLRGAAIELYKEIPTQAGLGGGSSDAASALIGLNQLWECGLSIKELSTLGAKLGSDIPFFIEGNYASIAGRGEIVTPLNNPQVYDIILMLPSFAVPTSWAYQKIARFSEGLSIDYCNQLNSALINRDISKIQILMKNDFEDALKDEFPEIDEIKINLIRHGAISAMLSGSGSAIFGVFADGKHIISALQSLHEIYPLYWMRHVLTIGQM